MLPTCVWIRVTTVFQNRANKQRHQTNPIHQRTRRTVNIPQRVLRIHLTEYVLTRRLILSRLWCWLFGCKCVTCMLKSGRRYGAVLSVPLATVEETKARLQPAEPKTTCYDEGTSVCVHDRDAKCTRVASQLSWFYSYQTCSYYMKHHLRLIN